MVDQWSAMIPVVVDALLYFSLSNKKKLIPFHQFWAPNPFQALYNLLGLMYIILHWINFGTCIHFGFYIEYDI